MLAQTDTVYVDKVIVDTVVEYRTQYIDRPDNSPNEVVSISIPESAVVPGVELPSLTDLNLENRGNSAAKDENPCFCSGLWRLQLTFPCLH